jgi:hypothetical protein
VWLASVREKEGEEERVESSKSGERDHSTFQLAVWRLPSNRCGSFSLPEFFLFFFSYYYYYYCYYFARLSLYTDVHVRTFYIPWQIQMISVKSTKIESSANSLFRC